MRELEAFVMIATLLLKLIDTACNLYRARKDKKSAATGRNSDGETISK